MEEYWRSEMDLKIRHSDRCLHRHFKPPGDFTVHVRPGEGGGEESFFASLECELIDRHSCSKQRLSSSI